MAVMSSWTRGYRGVHNCTGENCTASSDNKDHFLPDGRKTHSLLVHYVACHRHALAKSDLAYIDSLTDEAQPTSSELFGTREKRTKPSSSGRQSRRLPPIEQCSRCGGPEGSMCCAALSQAPRASGTGRYLSDGTAMDAVPLRFSSRERAVAQARALAQETLYR